MLMAKTIGVGEKDRPDFKLVLERGSRRIGYMYMGVWNVSASS